MQQVASRDQERRIFCTVMGGREHKRCWPVLFLGFERSSRVGGRDRCGGSAAAGAANSAALPPLTLAALKHHSIN